MKHPPPASRLSAARLLGASLVLIWTLGCQKAPELERRMVELTRIAQEAEDNGARICAPRALALARASLEFAEMELDKGELSRAEAHVKTAELNAEAARLESPAAHCAPQRLPAPPAATETKPSATSPTDQSEPASAPMTTTEPADSDQDRSLKQEQSCGSSEDCSLENGQKTGDPANSLP